MFYKFITSYSQEMRTIRRNILWSYYYFPMKLSNRIVIIVYSTTVLLIIGKILENMKIIYRWKAEVLSFLNLQELWRSDFWLMRNRQKTEAGPDNFWSFEITCNLVNLQVPDESNGQLLSILRLNNVVNKELNYDC
jgi:hypothetical protein